MSLSMSIESIKINHFRNLTALEIELSPQLNIIYGENGSGKTSILEAIYYFCMHRSFRSHMNQRIIQHGKDSFDLYGRFGEHTLGIQRALQKKTRIRFDGLDIPNILPVIKLLPVQLIDFQAFDLINGPREARRQFLDWGVFHVEHHFANLWNRYKHILKQRNSALKQRLMPKEVVVWDVELSELAQQINQQRREYIYQYLPVLRARLSELLPIYEFNLEFSPGWDDTIALSEVLKSQLAADYQLGYTRMGAHRADLILAVDQIPLKDILSRGQQKLTSAMMLLIQAELLEAINGKRALFLIDDLPAELDLERRRCFLQELNKNNFQTIITATDYQLLPLQNQQNIKMFHVEHGAIVNKPLG